jgi:thiol-disulfide isomerase/thioredoxin
MFLFCIFIIVIGCKRNQPFKIQVEKKTNYKVWLDTITSINRFIGYCYKGISEPLDNNNISISHDNSSIDIVEVSWKRITKGDDREKLVYKTDIQNSLFLFPDQASNIHIYPEKGTWHGENLSFRNTHFLNFQKKLEKFYTKRIALENWADSVKNLPVNESLKSYVYSTYKKQLHSINILRDSLALQTEKYNDKVLKFTSSVIMNSILPKEKRLEIPVLNKQAYPLDEKLIRNFKHYRQFKGEPQGDIVPAFYDRTVDGNLFGFEELRGKIVLIDFWASYCGPCLRKSKNVLKPVYQKYHDKGFEILGVSLDKDIERWKKTVADKGYPWININCSEIYSPIEDLFNVSDIPSLVLIDQEGKFIARDLGKDEIVKILDTHLSIKK